MYGAEEGDYDDYLVGGYPEPTEYYDIDQGIKTSLASNVFRSNKGVSTMRSSVPRFRDVIKKQQTPFGVYDIDHGNKTSLSSGVRDTRRFYSSTFNPGFRRMGKMQMSNAPDVMYDAARLKSGRHSTMTEQMENTPNKMSILRSKYPRFSKVIPTAAPDVVYDIDRGNKSSLYSTVQNSAQSYAALGKTKTSRGLPAKPTSLPVELGPGSYDTAYRADLQTNYKARPLATLHSTSSRFYNDKLDPTKNLGSTWRQEHDDKAWDKPTTIARQQYFRPQYVPRGKD